MGFLLGRKLEHETLRFPCSGAAAGDERYLLCAAGAAAIVWGVSGSLGVLPPVVVHVCVVLCAC